VHQRWKTGQADRNTARAADRQRRQITDWWRRRQRNLPAAFRAAIVDRHHQIVTVLHRIPDHARRDAAVSAAAASVNWRDPDAADRFIGRLQSVAAAGPTNHHASHANQHTASHEP
jgi:hypothetical protein